MITTALISIVTMAMVTLYAKVTQGMASDEMHSALQKGNQNMLNRIRVRVGANRHFFFGGAGSSGVSFIAKLNLSTAPATLIGTTLSQPQTSVSGSLSSSVSDFNNALVGNSILFSAYDVPETVIYPNGTFKGYTDSPMTVSSATVSGSGAVTDQNGVQQTVIIDLYRFYYYYLSSATAKQLVDGTDYSVIEWQSIRLADIYEIANYASDGVFESNIMACMKSRGVSEGYDPTQTDPTLAFTNFGSVAFGTSSPAFTSDPNYVVPMDVATNVTKCPSGILTSGFRYGISPNSNNWRSSPVQVPLFAPVTTVGVAFPNGFEVVTGGGAAGRQVMIRSVWVAEGAITPRAVYNDVNMVDYARDVW